MIGWVDAALTSPVTGLSLLADTAHSLAAGPERWPVLEGIPFLRADRRPLADAALAVPTDQPTLDKLLASMTADDAAKTLGLHGGQQQALALWSLHSASPTAKPDDTANKSIQSLLESTAGETPFDAAVFATKLKAAQETLKK